MKTWPSSRLVYVANRIQVVVFSTLQELLHSVVPSLVRERAPFWDQISFVVVQRPACWPVLTAEVSFVLTLRMLVLYALLTSPVTVPTEISVW